MELGQDLLCQKIIYFLFKKCFRKVTCMEVITMSRIEIKLLAFVLFLLTLFQLTNANAYERTFYPDETYKGPVYVVIKVASAGTMITDPLRIGTKVNCFGKVVWGPHVGTFRKDLRVAAGLGWKASYLAVKFEKKKRDRIPLTVTAEIERQDFKIELIDFKYGRPDQTYTVISASWSDQ